jgi:mono/diheme cytochrome c family protein
VAVGLCLGAGLVLALLVSGVTPASGNTRHSRSTKKKTALKSTTVRVLAGKPSEFSFKLSRTKIAPGVVVFKVTNRGKIAHAFKICTRPTSKLANSCKGKTTKVLKPGKSATLKVTIKKKGHYEYLCPVAGHAAGGMKGMLNVGVKPLKTKTKTPPTTTTTTPTTTQALVGDPTAGAAVWKSAGCASCHTMKAAGATGTVGPNLDLLKPTEPAIVVQVTDGGGPMPAFGDQLTSKQIQDLAAYVYQSTH